MSPVDLQEKKDEARETRTVAAIDVGANAVRMVIAEVLPDGRIEVIERLQRATRLGQDAFRRGRLGAASMPWPWLSSAISTKSSSSTRSKQVRAVATSAAREASNSDTFLDRIYLATGLKVEVIGTPEESRLTVSAVRQALGEASERHRGETLIADVGGGSTLLTLLRDGEIVTSQSLRLGSVRLHEIMADNEDSPEQTAEVLRYQVSTMLASLQNSHAAGQRRVVHRGRRRCPLRRPPDRPADRFARPAPHRSPGIRQAGRACEHWTAEELAKRFGVPFAEAETINPALMVYQNLFRLTKATQIIVSSVTMRDGLLLELANRVTGKEDRPWWPA